MLSGEISKFSVIVTADVSLGLYRSQISMYKRLAVCKELQNCFSDLATIRQLRLLFLLKKKKRPKGVKSFNFSQTLMPVKYV